MNTCYFQNTYDDNGRVITQKDGIAGSITSTFAYEDNGKRITTDRNGNTSTRIFNSNGLLTSYTDENGNTKTYTYDSRYNVLKVIDANGHSITKSYNSFNKPTVITDKNGNKTFFTYDAAGNVTKIQYPEVHGVVPEETFVYNTKNQLTQHTGVRGTVTIYTYDDAAMPASKKVGSRNAMLYSYQNGLLMSQTDALGNTTTYGYNAIGQMTSKTDAKNQVTSYEYDACGNLLRTTDANGKTVVNTYDGNHQKTSVTDANGNKTEYAYNGNMKNTLVTLPDGKENNEIFGMMTHTCPLKYLPTEMFISTRQNATVKRKPRKAKSKKFFKLDIDRSTEEWLDKLEGKLNYKIWFCGHYHIDKQIDNVYMMHYKIRPLHMGMHGE